MCASALNLLRRRVILGAVKFRAKANAQNVSARTDKRSVACTDGYLDPIKRGSK